MVDELFLLDLARMGLELAGFVGLVAAIHRPSAGWLPQEVAGAKLILEFAIGASFFAVLPMPILQTISSVSLAWRICSWLLSAFLALQLWIQSRRIIALFSSGHPPRARWFVVVALFPGTLAALVVVAVNAVAWAAQAPYDWALVWLLAAPGMELFVFVYFYFKTQQRGR